MKQRKKQQVSINGGIRARELRIIDDLKGNLGVMSRDAAIKLAQEAGMDLIEISPDARPPVAKIMDYGKYMYDTKKKMKEIKARTKTTEVKLIQIKTGTGKGDLALKAGKIAGWLEEGQRIRIELYLRGRAKYIDKAFLQEKMDFFLGLIGFPYALVEGFKKSPKGLAILIEPKKVEKPLASKPKASKPKPKAVKEAPKAKEVSEEKDAPKPKKAPAAKVAQAETETETKKEEVSADAPKAAKVTVKKVAKKVAVKKVAKAADDTKVKKETPKPKKVAAKKTAAKKTTKKKEDDKTEVTKK